MQCCLKVWKGFRGLIGFLSAAAAGTWKKSDQAEVTFLKPDGLVVVNTVLMQNIQIATETLQALDFKTSIVQVQISRSQDMPWGDRLEARNPVWIISGIRKSELNEGGSEWREK